MKKQKKLLIAIIMLVTVLMTGCMTRETLKANEFKINLEKRGFSVIDKTSTQRNQSIKSYYIATSKEKKYSIEYYELDNEMSSQGIYLKYKESMISTGAQVSTEINLGNSSKYVDNYNGRYRVASRITNTVIWVDAKVEYQEEIKALLKEIGY